MSKQVPPVHTVRDYMKYARAEFKQADVNIKISTITKVREVRAQRLELATSRYYDWLIWKSNHDIKGRMMAILPRPANGIDAIGLAPVCNPEGTAILNYIGNDEVEKYQSKVIFTHEIGHLLGATHQITSKNIMSPQIPRHWYPELPDFLPVSIDEIKVCLGEEK